MMTDTERWQFVLHFAQMDLDALRPSGWLTLRQDLGWFLTGSVCGRAYYAGDEPMPGDMEIRPFEPPFPLDYPEEAFRALQKEILPLLHSWVVGARKRPAAFLRVPFQGYLAAPKLDGLVPDTGQHLSIVEGSTRDAFVLRLFALVVYHSTARLRCCPECGAIWYRVGKQQYCSRVCVNRATVRTWRQRQERQSQEQAQGHQRSVRKHSGAHPTRNPRSRKPVATKR